MFDRLGEIVYPRAAGSDDAVMEAAIEAGAQDVESDEDGHVIYAAFEDMGAVVEVLEASLGPAKTTAVIWKPKSDVPVSGEEAAKLVKLIDNLDDDDDVQNVFGNYAIDDAEMERLAG
jgi:transcriptional/translational regulatory protein YebC/TACO1